MIALVQRTRRKKHLASTKPGLGYWATLCDRPVQLDGTDFAPLQDVLGTIDRNDPTVCIECARMVVFAHVLATHPALLDGLPGRHLKAVAS